MNSKNLKDRLATVITQRTIEGNHLRTPEPGIQKGGITLRYSDYRRKENTDMSSFNESCNQMASVLPKKEDQEIIVYYSYPYKGKRINCYEVCNYNENWNFNYQLPRKAKIHTWKTLDKWMNSYSTKRYKRKPYKKTDISRTKSKLGFPMMLCSGITSSFAELLAIKSRRSSNE